MKKIPVLLFALLIAATAAAQKKKATANSGAAPLAQLNNLSMIISKQNLYLIIDNKKAGKDSILLKKYEVKGNPAEAKISAFTAKGTPLHLLSWSESSVAESKEKTENKISQYSEIWNLQTRAKAFSNLQITTKIKEIQYLDKLKNASQTVEKIRNEGLAFTLTKEGEVLLKNKTQENRLVYNASSNVFQNTKDLAPKKK